MKTAIRHWTQTVTAAALVATIAAQADPLPPTCEAPPTKGSSLTIRIQLTPDAFKGVVFDHPKSTNLPAAVIGQATVCTCVDGDGNVTGAVKLVRQSGSPQLDSEAVEIGKTLSYPAGHPGCVHNTVNFAAP
ncbi:MAG: hypothetical protein JSR66_14160 [Proteobacteria bacterium]|nr:hypothetical protein [Pseudomonadota bacterium]